VTWTGDGDGQSWLDPLNWDLGRTPAAGDDVTVAAAARVRVAGAAVTVRDLDVAGPLRVESGLTVTRTGVVRGELTAAPGATLGVTGGTFTALGDTFVSGANLSAAGGTLDLRRATVYSHAATAVNVSRTIAATAAGQINLSGVRAITGGTVYGSRIDLRATGGGRLDLGGVVAITDPDTGDTRERRVNLTVDRGLVDLSALVIFTDRTPDSSWTTASSAAVPPGSPLPPPPVLLLGSLAEATGLSLAASAEAQVNVAGLRSFRHGTLAVTATTSRPRCWPT